MKILQVCAPIVRPNQSTYGSSFSTVLLCEELRRQGHEVTMAVREGADLAALARRAGIPVAELKFHGRRSPLAWLTLWQLARLARKTQADVIATQLSRGSYFGACAGKMARVPVVSSMRAMDKAKDYAGADRILAVSHAVKSHLVSQGVPASKVDVVHNGIETAEWQQANGDRIRAKQGISESQLLIGVVARLDPSKGHKVFLEAAAAVRKQQTAKFVLVGDGEEDPALRKQAADLGIAEDVIFAGYQTNIPEWVAAMDIVVLPSLSSEGLPRTMLEAGAAGKPSVATDAGGNAEVVLHGKTGLVVPPNDAPALAAALAELAADPAKRTAMGQAALENIEANFTLEAMARKTVEVYRAAGAKG